MKEILENDALWEKAKQGFSQNTKKKYAVRVTETLARTVIVEADDYLEAEDKVANAYRKGTLQLNADNAACDVEFSNETEECLEVFGKEEFEELGVCDEVY